MGSDFFFFHPNQLILEFQFYVDQQVLLLTTSTSTFVFIAWVGLSYPKYILSQLRSFAGNQQDVSGQVSNTSSIL